MTGEKEKDGRVLITYQMDKGKEKEIVAQNNPDLLGQIKDLVSTSFTDVKRSNDYKGPFISASPQTSLSNLNSYLKQHKGQEN